MKKVNIGILGFGNVGTGTYRVLEMNKNSIKEKNGIEFEVLKVLARDLKKDRGVQLPAGVLTDDPDDILKNADVGIVVEALGGIEPATTYMLEAMKAGKHVVTANKAAVAANYEKLKAAAEENKVEFRFEASVGGAVPVLSAIEGNLAANGFTEIMGIVNGTTNYILTQMTEFGLEYEAVLKKAQELGFAEADPTADVEGIDVANKLSILMALTFGKYIKPQDIPTYGITGVTREDIEDAKATGNRIKLVAHAKLTESGEVVCSISPTTLPLSHPLAHVNDEFNAVYVTGNASGEIMLYGRGAGALPTGSAVAGDILAIAKGIQRI